MGWYYFPPYVSVGEKKDKAAKKLVQLQKKDPSVTPIIIEGKKIATTWWGKAWCKNLESYADYDNRIQRGSAYVKNGFVLDLRIEEGVVNAKVYGSSLYKVVISIDKLNKACKEDIVKQIGHKINSIEDLVSGNFPEALGEKFLSQPVYAKPDKADAGKKPTKKTAATETIISGGLFPSPKEIKFDCNCPDEAYMCKHVAAVLYGIGARLDSDPLLFFKLRGIDVNAFIKKSIDEKIKHIMKNTDKKTKRIIENADLKGLFGI